MRLIMENNTKNNIMSKEFKKMEHIKNIKSGENNDNIACELGSLHSTPNLSDVITKKIVKNINDKRNEIISRKLIELGLEVEFNLDIRRRFKKFITEIVNDSETLYYDDGSIHGLRIITFVTEHAPIDFTNKKLTVVYNLSYH